MQLMDDDEISISENGGYSPIPVKKKPSQKHDGKEFE
jgi:hypothetical protein